MVFSAPDYGAAGFKSTLSGIGGSNTSAEFRDRRVRLVPTGLELLAEGREERATLGEKAVNF
jgi:hypothetical protein